MRLRAEEQFPTSHGSPSSGRNPSPHHGLATPSRHPGLGPPLPAPPADSTPPPGPSHSRGGWGPGLAQPLEGYGQDLGGIPALAPVLGRGAAWSVWVTGPPALGRGLQGPWGLGAAAEGPSLGLHHVTSVCRQLGPGGGQAAVLSVCQGGNLWCQGGLGTKPATELGGRVSGYSLRQQERRGQERIKPSAGGGMAAGGPAPGPSSQTYSCGGGRGGGRWGAVLNPAEGAEVCLPSPWALPPPSLSLGTPPRLDTHPPCCGTPGSGAKFPCAGM